MSLHIIAQIALAFWRVYTQQKRELLVSVLPLFCMVAAVMSDVMLLQEFVPVARELEKNWTRFSPHYIVWVCPRVYRQSAECQSQCIHQGRYCTPDPDGDMENGYSGADVVQVGTAGEQLLQCRCECSVSESDKLQRLPLAGLHSMTAAKFAAPRGMHEHCT